MLAFASCWLIVAGGLVGSVVLMYWWWLRRLGLRVCLHSFGCLVFCCFVWIDDGLGRFCCSAVL